MRHNRALDIIIVVSSKHVTTELEMCLSGSKFHFANLYQENSMGDLLRFISTKPNSIVVFDALNYKRFLERDQYIHEFSLNIILICKDEYELKKYADYPYAHGIMLENLSSDQLEHIIENIMPDKNDEHELKAISRANRYTEKEALALVGDLEPYFSQFQSDQELFALLFISIDNLADIQCHYSYDVTGIMMGQAISEIKLKLRPEDKISQLGSQIISVLLADIRSPFDAGTIAKKIIDLFSGKGNKFTHGHSAKLSVGIACYSTLSRTPESMLNHAEDAMLRAEQSGGNQPIFFSEQLNKSYSGHVQIQEALLSAISENEFYLVYQPKLRLKDSTISGVETLMRWHSPGLGAPNPQDFIAVAEKNNLIIPLGRWLIERACCQYVSWKEHGIIHKGMTMAINFSLVQLMDEGIVDYIEKMFEKYSINTDYFEFELTESSYAYDEQVVSHVLNRIKKIGVGLYIDDFGTGFASFEQVKNWPLDGLKIDKIFVDEIGKSELCELIIKSILSFCKSANLHVIAEGVETENQLTFLKKYGCDEIQGYILSKPLPVEEVEKLLKTNKL